MGYWTVCAVGVCSAFYIMSGQLDKDDAQLTKIMREANMSYSSKNLTFLEFYQAEKPLRWRARHYGELATEITGNAKLYVHQNCKLSLTGIKIRSRALTPTQGD